MLWFLNTRYWHPAFKTLFALVLTVSVGMLTGVYITYPDLVTVSYVGTVIFYLLTAYFVRKIMY